MSEKNDTLVRVEHLKKYFPIKGVKGPGVQAVEDISIEITRGEPLGLVGESGCGKSVTSLSIMKLLARNSKISNGEILLNGKDLLKEDKKGMRKIRGREVAMIFQEPMNSLNPCMRIEKQLTEAILLHNNFSKEEAHNRAFEVLKSVGIPEPDMTLKSYPHQLSGGMRQRAALIRTLAVRPDILLLDEPFSALDYLTRVEMQEWLLEQWEHYHKTILFITHDVEEAVFLSKKIFVIQDRPFSSMEMVEVPLPAHRDRNDLKKPEIVDLKERLIGKLRRSVRL